MGALVVANIATAQADALQDALNKQRDFNAVQVIYRHGVPHTDRRGRLMTAYDPDRSFFQIAVWGTPLDKVYGHEYDLTVLKEAGLNTVWPWPMYSPESALELAQKAELQVVLMNKLNEEELEQVKDHPHLLGNMWMDEPIGRLGSVDMDELFGEFLAYKETANRIAPDIPVFINDAPWIMAPATAWWVKWNTAGDVSCHDNYPVMHRRGRVKSIGAEPNGVPQSVSLAVAANQEQKPVWLIVGAFDTPSSWGAAFPFRYPTPEQLCACVYAGIIHGATGIIYFTWDTYISRDGAVIGMSPDPQVAYVPNPRQENYPHPTPATPLQMVKGRSLWETATQINKELRDLTPAILSPTVGDEVKYTVNVEGESPTEMPIRCLLKPHPDGGYVLLTVNIDDAVLNVTYSFPQPLAQVHVLYENRQPEKLEPDSSSFTLMYDPFATHVVRIHLGES